MFLLKVDKPELKHWYANATDDDILYAMELMSRFRIHLINLKDVPTTTWDISNKEMAEANDYLSKFRLKGTK